MVRRRIRRPPPDGLVTGEHNDPAVIAVTRDSRQLTLFTDDPA